MKIPTPHRCGAIFPKPFRALCRQVGFHQQSDAIKVELLWSTRKTGPKHGAPGLTAQLRREHHEVERAKKLSFVFPELRHAVLPRD